MKSIGEVAAQFDLPAHVLRHWESEGLLSPKREGDRRRYTETDMLQVAAILYARRAGFSLPDIRTILLTGTAERRHEVTARHMTELRDRIAHAQAVLAMLKGGLDCPHDDVLKCPTFQERVRALPGCADLVPPGS